MWLTVSLDRNPLNDILVRECFEAEISRTGRVEHFEFGLDLILDGLERTLGRRRDADEVLGTHTATCRA